MLRKKYSTYVVDLPGRGRAGRTSNITSIKPIVDEMFWFDIWRRIGFGQNTIKAFNSHKIKNI